MPDSDNDNVTSDDLAGIAIPTISEVLAAYLAEEKARLKRLQRGDHCAYR